MRALYIDRRDTVLAYRDAAIEIRTPNANPATVPLRGLQRLVISSSATLSTGLLSQCWERDIGVLVLSGRRSLPTARFYGQPHNDATLRINQAILSQKPEIVSELARLVVIAKLTAQVRFLRKLGETRPGGRALIHSAVVLVADMAARLRTLDPMPVDAVRGHEGAAAAAYFGAFTGFFPPSLGFVGRVRRPPRDPVNAALSLGYVLASFEASRQAQIIGLDPKIGALHALASGRDSLGLDLVEPARPKIDALVHSLFAARQLRADHFRAEDDGAILLGKAGRAIFYQAFEAQAPALGRYLRLGARRAAFVIMAQAGMSAQTVALPANFAAAQYNVA